LIDFRITESFKVKSLGKTISKTVSKAASQTQQVAEKAAEEAKNLADQLKQQLMIDNFFKDLVGPINKLLDSLTVLTKTLSNY
jgi:methionine synthase I (cobalamin-dependent)